MTEKAFLRIGIVFQLKICLTPLPASAEAGRLCCILIDRKRLSDGGVRLGLPTRCGYQTGGADGFLAAQKWPFETGQSSGAEGHMATSTPVGKRRLKACTNVEKGQLLRVRMSAVRAPTGKVPDNSGKVSGRLCSGVYRSPPKARSNQIVGGTLTTEPADLRTNFISERPARWFAGNCIQSDALGRWPHHHARPRQ